MRSIEYGPRPLVLLSGTFICRYTVSPSRRATTASGAPGARFRGASGGPFLPQPTSSARDVSATSAASARREARGALARRSLGEGGRREVRSAGREARDSEVR